MKADRLIKWFMPKEGRFQELLGKDTTNLLDAARVFEQIAGSSNLEDRRVKTVQLKAIEHAGDQLTRQIFEALNATFITPLDREDIRALATDVDDILDYVEGVAQSMVLFELEDSPEALRQFGTILVAMAAEIERAASLIWDMRNEKRIHDAIVRISELENQADRLYATVIADLFRADGRDPIQILKWKEVYEGLEEACDACKDLTHVIGNVVLKNA